MAKFDTSPARLPEGAGFLRFGINYHGTDCPAYGAMKKTGTETNNSRKLSLTRPTSEGLIHIVLAGADGLASAASGRVHTHGDRIAAVTMADAAEVSVGDTVGVRTDSFLLEKCGLGTLVVIEVLALPDSYPGTGYCLVEMVDLVGIPPVYIVTDTGEGTVTGQWTDSAGNGCGDEITFDELS